MSKSVLSYKEEEYIEYKEREQTEASVWFWFKRHLKGQSALCKTCPLSPPVIIPTKNYNTTGLFNHLKRVHKKDIQNVGESSEPNSVEENDHRETQSSKKRQRPKEPPKIDTIFISTQKLTQESAIAELVARDGLPFRKLVKSRVLRKLFVMAGLGSPPNSEVTIKTMVMNYAEKIKSVIKADIKTRIINGEKFSLTLEEWSCSPTNRRYVNINLHDAKSKFTSLGLVPVRGTLDANALLTLVDTRITEFGLSLENDIVCSTSDGCSLMIKFGTIVPCGGKLCDAHALQLAVCDLLYPENKKKNNENDNSICNLEATSESESEDSDWEDLEDEESSDNSDIEFDSTPQRPKPVNNSDVLRVIKKVRALARTLRKSSKKKEILLIYVKADFAKQVVMSPSSRKFSKPVGMILDNKTRWSSLYKMLERYRAIEIPLELTVKVLKKKKMLNKPVEQLLLDEKEKDVLNSVVNALEPVKNAVEALCREDATLLSADRIFEVLFGVIDRRTEFGETLLSKLRARIKERRTKYSQMLSFLHFGAHRGTANDDKELKFLTSSLPKMKRWLSDLLSRLLKSKLGDYPTSDDEDMGFLTEQNPGQYLSNSIQSSPSSSDSELNAPNSKRLFSDAIAELENPKEKSNSNPKPNKSVRDQINEEYSAFVSSGEHKLMGPHLKLLYNFLKTIKPTSVESERAFSAAGLICTKLRANLNCSTLDSLSFLNSFFKNNMK